MATPVPADYDALSPLLDVPIERLGRAWGAVGHLNEVADTPALRAAYNDAPAARHRLLHAPRRRPGAVRQVPPDRRASAEALKPAQRQALQHTLRDFVLGGAELQGAARERFAQIQERAAELQQRFGEHVLDATDGFAYLASAAELAGVPDDVRAAARVAAALAGDR